MGFLGQSDLSIKWDKHMGFVQNIVVTNLDMSDFLILR